MDAEFASSDLVSADVASKAIGVDVGTFNRVVRPDLKETPRRSPRVSLDEVLDWVESHKTAPILRDPLNVTGWVYAVEAVGVGRVKIGWTGAEMKFRLGTIQSCCPVPLRMIGRRRGTLRTERSVHARFSHLRLHGEWFELTEELATVLSGAEWL